MKTKQEIKCPFCKKLIIPIVVGGKEISRAIWNGRNIVLVCEKCWRRR